jgi:hypothetical protein
MHQLYGGEVSDHFKVQGKLISEIINATPNNDQRLGDIYNSQVKPIGNVTVTNSSTNMSVDALIERQPDPLVQQLQNTLTRIAQEYGVMPDNTTNTNFKPTLKDQSNNDIQQANDAVLKALEELKALGEI